MYRSLCLGALSLACSGAATAGAEVSTQRGSYANFSAMIDSGDGCTYTVVTVYIAENTSAGGGPPTTGLSGFGWWDVYNGCDGTFTWTDGAFTSVTLSTSSSDATISGEVALTDWFTGDPAGTMTLDVTLTGDGTAYRGISNYAYTFGGGMYRFRSVGVSYNGDASGTANDQTLTSGFGQWGSSTSGAITRYSY